MKVQLLFLFRKLGLREVIKVSKVSQLVGDRAEDKLICETGISSTSESISVRVLWL